MYSDACLDPPDALYNTCLKIAKKPLIDIYDRYRRGDYKVPVQLKVISKDNYGV
jgi:hypothetical protein